MEVPTGPEGVASGGTTGSTRRGTRGGTTGMEQRGSWVLEGLSLLANGSKAVLLRCLGGTEGYSGGANGGTEGYSRGA
jgi:hypothetical protein